MLHQLNIGCLSRLPVVDKLLTRLAEDAWAAYYSCPKYVGYNIGTIYQIEFLNHGTITQYNNIYYCITLCELLVLLQNVHKGLSKNGNIFTSVQNIHSDPPSKRIHITFIFKAESCYGNNTNQAKMVKEYVNQIILRQTPPYPFSENICFVHS